MDLHNQIMNIPTEIDFTDWSDHDRQSYKRGHRDARHVAAELSLKAEARIEELEEMLREVFTDSGFRCLCEELQDKISESV